MQRAGPRAVFGGENGGGKRAKIVYRRGGDCREWVCRLKTGKAVLRDTHWMLRGCTFFAYSKWAKTTEDIADTERGE